MASIEIDDAEILRVLRRLQDASSYLRPALLEIGEDLVESTKQRFETSTAPDGSDWLLNSALSTLLYKAGDKPLVDGGTLSHQINKDVTGDTLEVGSTMEYAAMQQFGGTKEEFPYLWGDIPARPFLGVSQEDKDNILAVLNRHIEAVLR
ncbi:MAG: phage virion morphogenesis protein [Methylovulum sp.]|uniref:phage virion morphogenesis protein n=1 Tax=Methylovulum sp. TaxID=1916980 RepID=UPI002639042E|nr:phage virion morphogenesis protein [Methylovulum sp.]MDD2723564.1 phage virion morphogenesis protein [Methylovulum sp.]MDD5124170.1 phage virion morphogenesis protein [Methylovulum sp.]